MSILKIFFKNFTTLECKNCRTKYQAKETRLYTVINFFLEDLGVFIVLFLSAYTTVYIDSEIYKLDAVLFFWINGIFMVNFLFYIFVFLPFNYLKFNKIWDNKRK